MSGPLTDVRVVDCTTVVLGPWAAQQLGDLGADVVKVEPPEGDTTRQLGPMRNPDMGAFYLAVNRNKRSIVLDLKQEPARRVLQKLAAGADVLLHNYRPQAARRLGMSYETFRAVNPGIVYVGTYGFRAAGPYGEKPAYDDIIQAASGLASAQGLVHGGTALCAHDRRRQDQLADGAGRRPRRALPQGAYGRGAGGRGADVREHGGLGAGGAPLR